MASAKPSASVESYIQHQPSPQREIIARIRALVHEVLPNAKETMKNGFPWYEGTMCMVALKHKVKIGFFSSASGLGELAGLTQSDASVQSVEYGSLDEIDEEQLKSFMAQLRV